jgi:hypothetical protein
LRVTGHTPTFLALLREMALHPLERVSPFLADDAVETSHATPYMQVLAWIWGRIGPSPAGAPALVDPEGAFRVLGIAGMVATVALLHAFFLWARRQAGVYAAWCALPILLVLFGPAHVLWAGDLTFHGFMYASGYPQTVALALLLYTLVVLDTKRLRLRVAGGTLLAGGTMVVHPFTGALLVFLVAADGMLRARRREEGWWVGSVAIVGGFALAELWPAYSLNDALAVVGPSGLVLVVAAACLPIAAERLELGQRASIAGRLQALLSDPAARMVLGFGLVVVLAFAGWQAWSIVHPDPDPHSPANRLALYWVEDRWRWPLMLASGSVGVLGLVRLARLGRSLPSLWFGTCLGVCVVGLAGVPVPVWWRFLLFCQLPLALGVADVLTRARPNFRLALIGVLGFSLAFKLVTLFGVSDRFSYFGQALQPAYALGEVVPANPPGLVATDPFTAYFVPGATGHRVLSVTKAHVGSDAELAASNRGYDLLHEFYSGEAWWEAAQEMWRRGVRYVVVEHHTSLAPRTLAAFSTGPTPLVTTTDDRRQLGTYFYRNNRVGSLLSDSDTYAVYRLDERKLWP